MQEIVALKFEHKIPKSELEGLGHWAIVNRVGVKEFLFIPNDIQKVKEIASRYEVP